jgi:hypothetical protein
MRERSLLSRCLSYKRKQFSPVLISGAVVTEQNAVQPQDKLFADRDMNTGPPKIRSRVDGDIG